MWRPWTWAVAAAAEESGIQRMQLKWCDEWVGCTLHPKTTALGAGERVHPVVWMSAGERVCPVVRVSVCAL